MRGRLGPASASSSDRASRRASSPPRTTEDRGLAPRNCGTCSACCRWPSVAEIDKPAREPCRFLEKQAHHCTRYDTRPEACSAYHCTWIRGHGSSINNRDRPDSCGVLIDRRSTQFGVVLVAKSLTPGAAMSPKGQKAIERTTRDEGLPCLVINDDEQIIAAAGPPDFMQEVVRKGPELGGQREWLQNIVAYAMQEKKAYPGLQHGG